MTYYYDSREYGNGNGCKQCTRNPGCRFMPREFCVQYTYRNAPAIEQPQSEQMRTCKTCGRRLPISDFPAYESSGKLYHRYLCRQCTHDKDNAAKAMETTIAELEKELAELKAQR